MSVDCVGRVILWEKSASDVGRRPFALSSEGETAEISCNYTSGVLNVLLNESFLLIGLLIGLAQSLLITRVPAQIIQDRCMLMRLTEVKCVSAYLCVCETGRWLQDKHSFQSLKTVKTTLFIRVLEDLKLKKMTILTGLTINNDPSHSQECKTLVKSTHAHRHTQILFIYELNKRAYKQKLNIVLTIYIYLLMKLCARCDVLQK